MRKKIDRKKSLVGLGAGRDHDGPLGPLIVIYEGDALEARVHREPGASRTYKPLTVPVNGKHRTNVG